MTRQELFQAADLVAQELTERFEAEKYQLNSQIKTLELEIAVLRAENDRIWQIAVDRIVKEKMRSRLDSQ